MYMIDVMTKLKEIAESGYDNEDVQRGIVAASKLQVEEAEVAEEEAVEEAVDEVVDEAEVAEEEAIEEDDVEEVHEDVEEDTSLADMLRLAGRSGVMGLNQNTIIAESAELDEEDELEEHVGSKLHAHPHEEEEIEEAGSGDGPEHADADADDKRWDDAEEADEDEEGDIDMEETVEVPVTTLQELMRLAGYENYEAKIEEYENEPAEEYSDAEDQLVGLSGGLNGPKGMYATAAGGDNAMSVNPLKVKEDTLSFESFYEKYEEFVTEEK